MGKMCLDNPGDCKLMLHENSFFHLSYQFPLWGGGSQGLRIHTLLLLLWEIYFLLWSVFPLGPAGGPTWLLSLQSRHILFLMGMREGHFHRCYFVIVGVLPCDCCQAFFFSLSETLTILRWEMLNFTICINLYVKKILNINLQTC